MVKHLFHRHCVCGAVTESDHGQTVADEDDVYSRAVDNLRGRIVIGGKADYFSTLAFVFQKRVGGNLLG
jgi:hypothetical protein